VPGQSGGTETALWLNWFSVPAHCSAFSGSDPAIRFAWPWRCGASLVAKLSQATTWWRQCFR